MFLHIFWPIIHETKSEISPRNKKITTSNFYQLHMALKKVCCNSIVNNKYWQYFLSFVSYCGFWISILLLVFLVQNQKPHGRDDRTPISFQSIHFQSCLSSWEIFSYVLLTALKDAYNYLKWSQQSLVAQVLLPWICLYGLGVSSIAQLVWGSHTPFFISYTSSELIYTRLYVVWALTAWGQPTLCRNTWRQP